MKEIKQLSLLLKKYPYPCSCKILNDKLTNIDVLLCPLLKEQVTCCFSYVYQVIISVCLSASEYQSLCGSVVCYPFGCLSVCLVICISICQSLLKRRSVFHNPLYIDLLSVIHPAVCQSFVCYPSSC